MHQPPSINRVDKRGGEAWETKWKTGWEYRMIHVKTNFACELRANSLQSLGRKPKRSVDCYGNWVRVEKSERWSKWKDLTSVAFLEICIPHAYFMSTKFIFIFPLRFGSVWERQRLFISYSNEGAPHPMWAMADGASEWCSLHTTHALTQNEFIYV